MFFFTEALGITERYKHTKNNPEDVKYIYAGHEVAVHTLTHPNLVNIEDDKEGLRRVEQDRVNLSELVEYEVEGMAYPCGGKNCDARVADIIKNNTIILDNLTKKSPQYIVLFYYNNYSF